MQSMLSRQIEAKIYPYRSLILALTGARNTQVVVANTSISATKEAITVSGVSSTDTPEFIIDEQSSRFSSGGEVADDGVWGRAV